ncbi:MAG TPA: NAD(P)/FAD-dependent oxidoreductase [Euzebyales bacterium]|nr:NAD(P)/FAD-dependent oxidoreductase [Euzebyales bacterium]
MPSSSTATRRPVSASTAATGSSRWQTAASSPPGRWCWQWGSAYRRLGIETLEALTGAGVFYGAAVTEAEAMTDERVFVVGGGNSAGQAAVHLARFAQHVTLLVRGPSLADSMSDYLIRELGNQANIDIRYRTDVVDTHGDTRPEQLTLRDRDTGRTQTIAASALFVLIGAAPRTDWLPDEIARDRWGYLLTGNDLRAIPGGWALERPPLPLETSLPGVFAVGDVRHASVKRVASAVGEGSISLRMVHDYLAEQ